MYLGLVCTGADALHFYFHILMTPSSEEVGVEAPSDDVTGRGCTISIRTGGTARNAFESGGAAMLRISLQHPFLMERLARLCLHTYISNKSAFIHLEKETKNVGILGKNRRSKQPYGGFKHQLRDKKPYRRHQNRINKACAINSITCV